MKRIYQLSFLVFFLCLFINVAPTSAQLSGSQFNPGRIIDDAVFANKNSMSVSQIQQFLESKVGGGACDVNGSKASGRWNAAAGRFYTRAEWGALSGNAAPYVCLTIYRENPNTKETNLRNPTATIAGSQSAAEIIWNASQQYNINPQVLLVTLQKEQSLITDDWPWLKQYQAATGAYCPDSGPNGSANCDPARAGFGVQVREAARLYRSYADDPWLYLVGNNNILFNPNRACGTSVVNIENAATASLYHYTPYQPNAAALNNLYGTGDTCSAYGNRNFWRMFNEWFGSTTSNEYYWSLVEDTSNGRVYIATTFALHYVPDVATLNAWGLDNVTIAQPSPSFFASRTIGSPVGKLLRDNFGNLFTVDNKQRHYVTDARLLQAWGIDINSAITVAGYVGALDDGRWLSSCAQSVDGNYWVVDSATRYRAASQDVRDAWGCTPVSSIDTSDWFINSIPASPNSAQRFIKNSANKKFLVDSVTLWSSPDNTTVDWYAPNTQTYMTVSDSHISLLPARTLTHFAEDTTTKQWFLIEPGKKFYIPSASLADSWGRSSFGGLSPLSSSALNTLSNGGTLTNAAQGGTPVRYYLLNNTSKNYLPDQTAIDEWLLPATTVIPVNALLLNKYSDGPTLTTPIAVSEDGQKYIMQQGTKKALSSAASQSWGQSTIALNRSLNSHIQQSGTVGYTAFDGTNYFYIEKGLRYPISASLQESWKLNSATRILSQTLARLPLQSQAMKPVVSIAGKTYGLSQLEKIELSDAVVQQVGSANIAQITTDPFSTSTQKSTHLIRSTVDSDFRLWLMGRNGKILLPNVATALNLGYISRSVELTRLSPDVISAITTDTTASSLIIASPGGAMKLVSYGRAYTLPNTDIALSYIGITGSVMTVPQSVFDIFPITDAYATRLIRDDAGKIYWIDAGKKRWILNGALLTTVFPGVKQTYLHSTVMTQIPDGQVIN